MKNLSRRNFVKHTGTAGAISGLALSGAAPSFSAPKLSCNPTTKMDKPLAIKAQRKALVCIMLDGGNDSFNMLVPRNNQHYYQYQKTRSNLALSRDELLPLKGFKDKDGREFGLHNAMPEVQQLFHDNKLSFIANVGPLIEPVSKQAFKNGSARIPLGLLSHADQFKHWQSSRPHERTNQGWFGYFADALQPNKQEQQISMNISLAGSNIMQNGVAASQYAITDKGSVGLIVNEQKSALNTAILNSFESLLSSDYQRDPFKQTYLSQTREAQAQHEVFKQATKNIRLQTRFSDSPLSQQLKKTAQSIAAANKLGMQQQTFFLRYIGWDHHDELLNNHAKMLGIVSRALSEFQNALEELGLEDQVVSFTGSDFGRTLTSNGNGTDHGWGGNMMVMGKPVKGGQVFGQYPELSLGDSNPLDAGDGVIIPTLATDHVFAELAQWFGVEKKEMGRLFPNLNNFFASGCDVKALGLIA